MKPKITLQQDHALKILADLEFLVVSLDRIGSAKLTEENRAAELEDFVTEGKVFKKLTTMRKLIWASLDKAHSESEILNLEERLEKVKKWKLKR